MPFGPTPAPTTWQAVINKAFDLLKWTDVAVVYSGDVCFYTFTVDEHLDVLDQSLPMLEKYGFRIEINKCQSLQIQIKYLGYTVSHEGKIPDCETSLLSGQHH